MGVSGCGKSTVARGLADALGLRFADADEFHPADNVARMRAGTALEDEHRMPWLRALAAWMAEQSAAGEATVLACSALTRAYRDVLRDGPSGVAFVHLDGPVDVVAERVAGRAGHFMPASLVASQAATLEPLEPDEEGVVLDLREDPAVLVNLAAQWVSPRLSSQG
jgi:gluconokinase